jgi:bifunctional N-acetylglucosamine-1-phosphate-uridyltransferase/glucosamine-1-phosphate-acetyltransferase GlmU-like protein
MPPWVAPLLIFAFCVFIVVLFLPALLELRKPKDAGPRKIPEITMEKIPRHAPDSAKSPKLSRVIKEHVPENLIHALNNLEGKEILNPRVDTICLAGEIKLPSDIVMRENLVVDGSLKIGNGCRFRRSVKVSKDVQIGSDVVIQENLIAGGSVKLGNGSVVNGLVDSGGSVLLGRNVSIGLSLTSGGDVELYENVRVGRGITSRGYVRVRKVLDTDIY